MIRVFHTTTWRGNSVSVRLVDGGAPDVESSDGICLLVWFYRFRRRGIPDECQRRIVQRRREISRHPGRNIGISRLLAGRRTYAGVYRIQSRERAATVELPCVCNRCGKRAKPHPVPGCSAEVMADGCLVGRSMAVSGNGGYGRTAPVVTVPIPLTCARLQQRFRLPALIGFASAPPRGGGFLALWRAPRVIHWCQSKNCSDP